MTLAPGSAIGGRYHVIRSLGAGGYGEVYEVVDAFQGDTVALKLIRGIGVGHVWHEAQVLTKLQSDYILPIRNADVVAGVPFVVTDVAKHGSADAAVFPVGVPIATAIRWTRGAARGAERAHAEGLVHRDIKPGNLFLTAIGGGMLGDFGLAHLMDAAGQAPPHGTPVTMAPEVASGGSTSAQSDVYSLGATLYALVAGRYPDQDPDPNVVVARRIAGPPTPIRDLAPHVGLGLSARIEKAMARAPADRYQSAAAFDAALGELPKQARVWVRTDEHAGHHGCWRGSSPPGPDITVCGVVVGGRFAVESRHQPSGRLINACCRPAGPMGQLPRKLRTAIAAAS